MKRIYSLLLIICLIAVGCAAPFSEEINTSTIPTYNNSNMANKTPEPSATPLAPMIYRSKADSDKDVFSENFILILDEADLDGDSIKDTVEITSTSESKETFRIRIKVKDYMLEKEFFGGMWPNTYFYCADITGDLLPEIIFTDFSYSSNADDIACAIYKIVSEDIIQIPLNNYHNDLNPVWDVNDYWNEYHHWKFDPTIIETFDSLTYQITSGLSDKEYSLDLRNYETEIGIGGVAADDNLELRDINQFFVSCWIEDIEANHYGFRLNRFHELYYSSENIYDTDPRVIFVISSLVEWDGRSWCVIDEDIMNESQFYKAMEKYYS